MGLFVSIITAELMYGIVSRVCCRPTLQKSLQHDRLTWRFWQSVLMGWICGWSGVIKIYIEAYYPLQKMADLLYSDRMVNIMVDGMTDALDCLRPLNNVHPLDISRQM